MFARRFAIGIITGLAILGAIHPASAQRAPAADKLLTRIAFGSCAHQDMPQPIWDAVLAYKPELFLFTGDNVYGDIFNGAVASDDQILTSISAAYAKTETIQGWRTLREQVPHLAVWDDHDYGKNDGGADFVHRDASQKLFADFWKLPADDPRRQRPGVYHAWTFGPQAARIQVIMLDTRYFRSPLKVTDQRGAKGRERYVPDPDPAKTVLGPDQWRWFLDRLKEPAAVRLIVTSIQALVEGHGFERWGNLSAEQNRLMDALRDTQGQIVLISGDRHVGAIYRQDRPGASAVHEITASGLTHAYAGADEPGPNRIGELFGAPNFGTVDIDWWAKSMTLSVRGVNGEPVRTHRIDLARKD